jgi:hypothetical protein
MGNPLASWAGLPALIRGNSFVVIILCSTVNVRHPTFICFSPYSVLHKSTAQAGAKLFMAMHDGTPSELLYYDILWEFHSFLIDSDNWWTARTRKKAKESAMSSVANAAEDAAALIKLVQAASKKSGSKVTAVHGGRAGENVVKVEAGLATVTTQLLMTHRRVSKITPVSAYEKAAKKLTKTSCGNFKASLLQPSYHLISSLIFKQGMSFVCAGIGLPRLHLRRSRDWQ